MKTPLTDRVAVVTGGNGGIGRAIALGLAEAGAAVALFGRNQEKTRQAKGWDMLAQVREAELQWRDAEKGYTGAMELIQDLAAVGKVPGPKL